MVIMYLSLIISLLAISANQRSFVDTASVPVNEGSDGSEEEVPRYMDDAVMELENLKNTVGSRLEMMKSHAETYTNFNGQEKGHLESKEQRDTLAVDQAKEHLILQPRTQRKQRTINSIFTFSTHNPHISSNYINANGRMVASIGQDLEESPDAEGNPQGRIRTKVDIPGKGIHKTLIHNLAGDQVPAHSQKKNDKNVELVDNAILRGGSAASDLFQIDDNMDKANNQYSGIQYSPLDMAEYVFWTGDEKGVTLAIEEFLQEGMMSREEAISFLQEIKYNLEYLQTHYTQLGANSKDRTKEKENTPNGIYFNKLKPTVQSTDQYQRSQFDYNSQKQEIDKKNSASPAISFNREMQAQREPLVQSSHDEDGYGELFERLRVADFLYTEYSLEEVIYQLAKVMFTQSLTRGSAEAQQALQKFTGFLESEAKQERISRALEKKVLDVLIAALTDTLNEHPELSAQERAPQSSQSRLEQQDLMNQLLKYTAENKQMSGMDGNQNRAYKVNPNQNQIIHNAAVSHLFGKYKNP